MYVGSTGWAPLLSRNALHGLGERRGVHLSAILVKMTTGIAERCLARALVADRGVRLFEQPSADEELFYDYRVGVENHHVELCRFDLLADFL